MSEPTCLLKIISHVDGTPRISEVASALQLKADLALGPGGGVFDDPKWDFLARSSWPGDMTRL